MSEMERGWRDAQTHTYFVACCLRLDKIRTRGRESKKKLHHEKEEEEIKKYCDHGAQHILGEKNARYSASSSLFLMCFFCSFRLPKKRSQ